MPFVSIRLALAAVFLAIAPAVIARPAQNPPPELTADQWREDLRFMAAEMEKRHANLYHQVSREAFAKAVADLGANIPSLQRNEIIVGMMRIAAMVGDGHTRIDPRKDARFGFRSLPVKLYLFEDGLFVRAAAPDHAGLVGARIESIGGVPVDEAIRRAAELASRDNEVGPKLYVPLYLAMPDILHALKLAPTRDAAILGLRKGDRRWAETVPAGAVDPSWPPDTDISLTTPEGWVDASTAPPPLWLQAPLDYHRLVDLPEAHALYAQLNMVSDTDEETLDAFGKKIGDRVRATNPRALILDLRLNQGGNGDLRNNLVRALIKAEDADTRLFVLTWRGTFSASQFILDDLDRLTDAVIVGEPASSRPSSFGDAYRMPMPNSGINVRTSIVWWQDGQNRDPWTWVDVAAPLRFADYAAGRDPALERALTYTPGPTLQATLLEAAASGGAAMIRRTLHVYRNNPENRYADRERQMLEAAQALFGAERKDEALLVAELAAQDYPASADAANVLAHLEEATGRRDLALEAGQRVLAIDPNNRAARALVERVSAAN